MNAALINGGIINGGVINGGVVNAGFLTSPLTDIGMMNAIHMRDVVNVPIYNAHMHFVGGKGGALTGPPTSFMV